MLLLRSGSGRFSVAAASKLQCLSSCYYLLTLVRCHCFVPVECLSVECVPMYLGEQTASKKSVLSCIVVDENFLM